jgi:hypothetical protein
MERRGRIAVVENPLAGAERLSPALVGFDRDGTVTADFADDDQFAVGEGLAV